MRVRKIPFRNHLARSAVAVIYRQTNQETELLLIKRATREGDPWSGHMAFPGGKQQEDDINAKATAVRETQEEIGLDLDANAQFKTRLSDLITRRHNVLKPMVVTPYLFKLDEELDLTPNHEVQSWVWVPVSFLMDKNNQSSMSWKVGPTRIKMPCFYFEGHCIWGLTLMMLKQIVQLEFGQL